MVYILKFLKKKQKKKFSLPKMTDADQADGSKEDKGDDKKKIKTGRMRIMPTRKTPNAKQTKGQII